MNLLRLTRRRIFTAIIFLGVVGLTLSALAQPQLIDSSLSANHVSLYQGGPTYMVTATKDTAQTKPTTNSNSTQNNSSLANAADTNAQSVNNTLQTSDGTGNGVAAHTISVKIRPLPPPKNPIPPTCDCPEPADESASAATVCPDHCAPTNPTPTPHCQPCGGFHKFKSSEAVMCPMYCVE